MHHSAILALCTMFLYETEAEYVQAVLKRNGIVNSTSDPTITPEIFYLNHGVTECSLHCAAVASCSGISLLVAKETTRDNEKQVCVLEHEMDQLPIGSWMAYSVQTGRYW